MRVLLVAFLFVAVAFAGCAESPSTASAVAATGGMCTKGEVVVGIEATGAPVCDRPKHLDTKCPVGEVVTGFYSDGAPRCDSTWVAETGSSRARTTSTPSQYEVSSNLKVHGVYGTRNDSSMETLDLLKVIVELSAGAAPMDLTRLVIRFSDGRSSYTFGSADADGDGFTSTWIRGPDNGGVMMAGDLVELAFHTWPATSGIPTRTSVTLNLIPETGAAVVADFKTPATYGTDTVITLR